MNAAMQGALTEISFLLQPHLETAMMEGRKTVQHTMSPIPKP